MKGLSVKEALTQNWERSRVQVDIYETCQGFPVLSFGLTKDSRLICFGFSEQTRLDMIDMVKDYLLFLESQPDDGKGYSIE